ACAHAEGAALPLQDERRLSGLIQKLGSDDFTEREAADAALRAETFSVFGALEKAHHNTADAEVRERLSRILTRLLSTLCAESHGHKVSLHFKDAPLRDALEALAPQIGYEPGAFTSILPAERTAIPVSIDFTDLEDCYALRWLFRLAGIQT